MTRGRPALRRAAGAAALAAAVALAVAWSAAPAAWQALTAAKPDAQITRVPTVYLPSPPTLDHVRSLLERKPFARYLANSAQVAAGATLLCLLAAAPAAAALARFGPAARRRLLGGLLAVALVPPILLLFPLYEGARALGWINHPAALMLPYAALHLPLAVWVLDSAFQALPRALDEAARLDGLSPLRRLWRVHLPLVAPSVATAAILVFIFAWNEFMLAVTFMTRDTGKTVTAGIASVAGASLYEIPWGPLAAAVTIATLPLLALVFAFQRRIVSGLTRGAVKG